MSQWGPNPKSLTPSQEEESSTGSTPQGVDEAYSAFLPKQKSKWFEILPFFLSAVFFLTAFFAVFAPLPILFTFVRRGRKWAYLASLTNAFCVGWMAGSVSLILFLVFSVTVALVLGEAVTRKKTLEKTVILTLGAMVLVGVSLGLSYARVHHLNPLHQLKERVSSVVDYFGNSTQNPWLNQEGEEDPGLREEFKNSLVLEFPSGVAIFSLITVWSNLLILLGANPNRIREKLGLEPGCLKKWKAPDVLVWPTIVSGALLLLNLNGVSVVALNVFKFLMAIYAIQGLSILSFFFDMWSIRGFLRVLGFSLSVLFMMPLVLSLGFFDLWFDFRAKFRQS